MTNFHLLDIAPLEPLKPTTPDTFTYFSLSAVEKGALVKIRLRRNEKFGYVIKTQKLTRLSAKKLPFQLKPIKAIVSPHLPVTTIQEQLVQWLIRHANLSLGHAWHFCLQPFLKTNLFTNQQLQKISLQPKRGEKFFQIYNQQLEPNQLKPPVLIIVPSEDYFQPLKQELSPLQPIVIDFSLSNKKLQTVIEKILNRDKAIYISTKQSAFLPWLDLTSIVIYREGSPLFKDYFKPPYLNYIPVIEKLAQLMKLKLLLIDDLPSLKIQVEYQIQPSLIEFQTFFGLETLSQKLQNYKRSIIITPQKAAPIAIKPSIVLNATGHSP